MCGSGAPREVTRGGVRAPGNRRLRALRPVSPHPSSGSARGAGEECGDDVGGATVERSPAPVVAHGGEGIGLAGRLLHVAQRYASIQGRGDEEVGGGCEG